MIAYDFALENLLPVEKRMLFRLRFRYRVPREFFGDRFDDLYQADFIRCNYSEEADPLGMPIPDGTYSLSNKYYRYIAFRRTRFFHGTLWPCLISGACSVLVSLIVSWIT